MHVCYVLALVLSCVKGQSAALAPVAKSAETPQASPTSLTGKAAASVLEEKERMKEVAMRDAIEADVPSREETNGDKSSGGGFQSWSQLYQWAVNASVGSSASRSSGNGGDAEGTNGVVPDVAKELDVEAVQKAALERRAVLENMADNLPEIEGEIVVLEKAVAVLKEESRGPGEVENALETIAELCHSGDNGIDLHTIGGLAHVVRLVNDGSMPPAVHQAAGKTLAICTQNNPPVAQAAVMDLESVPPLLQHAATLSAPLATRARSLMALASLVESQHTLVVLESDPSHSEMVVDAVKTALDCDTTGRDEQRSALRALAFSEGLVRAKDVGAQWKSRLEDGGVPILLENIISGVSLSSEDMVEAASRLAKIMDL